MHGDGSMIVNNAFEGTAPSYRPGSLYFSGDNVKVVANRFDNVETGILLLGNDRDFGNFYGIASNAKAVANRFCEVDEPIEVENPATGKQAGNKLDTCH